MRGSIVVHLKDGTALVGVEHEFVADEAQATIQRFLEAEGQGSLVIDGGHDIILIVPTRSINYVSLNPSLPSVKDTMVASR